MAHMISNTPGENQTKNESMPSIRLGFVLKGPLLALHGDTHSLKS